LFANNTTLSKEYLDYKVSYFKDSSNSVTLDEVQKKHFEELKLNYIHYEGFSKDTHWVKLEIIKNKEFKKDIDDFVVFVSNATIDDIYFYDKFKLLRHTGDNQSITSKEYDKAGHLFSLNLKDLKKDAKKTYFFKIRTQNLATIKLNIYTKKEFDKRYIFAYNFIIFFIGFMSAILLYNLFLYIKLRDSIYLYYILFHLAYAIFELDISGFGYHFIWVDNIAFNEFVYHYFDDMMLIFGLMFSSKLLHIKEHFDYLDKVIRYYILFLSVCLIFDLNQISVLYEMGLVFGIILYGYIAISAYKKQLPSSSIYLFGWGFLSLGALFMTMKLFGYIPVSNITTWSFYIAPLIESIIFSFALANRIDYLKQQNYTLLENFNSNLKSQVNDKTKSINDLLDQKELLLQEVNHRVKNNLQVILGYITIMTNRLDSPQNSSKELFISLKNRIESISLLHQNLYEQDDIVAINLEKYFHDICFKIQSLYQEHNVRFLINTHHYNFDFEYSMILGELVNEIVTNSLKYAFDNTSSNPTINISLTKEKDEYILEICDNGIGYIEDVDEVKNQNSLGKKLIKKFITHRLKGSYTIDNQNGTKYFISFPIFNITKSYLKD
jgi:two-component sensor histidine kinase